MIKRMNAYVLKMFLKLFFMVTVLLAGLHMIFATFQNSSYLTEYDITFVDLVGFNGILIPMALYKAAPIIMVIALIGTMIGLMRSNELIGMISIGVKVRDIAMAFVGVGFILSVILLYAGNELLPRLEVVREIYKAEVFRGETFNRQEKLTNIWLIEGDNRFIHISVNDPIENRLQEITEYVIDDDFRVARITTTAVARKVGDMWESEGRVEFDVSTTPPTRTELPDITRKNDTYDDFLVLPDQSAKLLSGGELKNLIKIMDERGLNTEHHKVVYYNKISHAFGLLALIIAVLPVSINYSRHMSFVLIAAKGLLMATVYWFAQSAFFALGKSGILGPLLANAIAPSVFFILGLLLILRREKGM